MDRSAAQEGDVMPHNAKRSVHTNIQKRRFGPLEREVSIIGQGTWYIEEGDPAVDMNHIDTAEMYGAGLPPKSLL